MSVLHARGNGCSWALRTLVILGGLAAAANPSASYAQKEKPAPNKKAVAEDKTLLTKDGIAIKISYYRSNAGEDAPVIVLLHGKPGKGNRLVWKNFASLLQQDTDYAVVTVDLSGHGESGSRGPKVAPGKKPAAATFKPAEYQAMVAQDIEAVKKFLFEENQKKALNMNKLVIVGADFSAALAIAYADFDWQKKRYDDAPTVEQQTQRGEDVRGLILLSPEEHAPGLTIAQSLNRLKALGVPVMIGVSKKDKLDKNDAKKIYDQLAPKKLADPDKQYVYLVEYEGALRGTDLLGQDGQRVENNMLAFLEKNITPMPILWKDRRSRLDRDDDEDKPKKAK